MRVFLLAIVLTASAVLVPALPAARIAAQAPDAVLLTGQTPILAGPMVAGETNAVQPLPGRAVALAGGRAYVAAEGIRGTTHCASVSKLAVFAPVAGAAPRLVGELDLGYTAARDLAVERGYAYVATGPYSCADPRGSLRAVDLRTPAAPTAGAEVLVTGWTGPVTTWLSAVAVVGAHAYATLEGGLQTFDLEARRVGGTPGSRTSLIAIRAPYSLYARAQCME